MVGGCNCSCMESAYAGRGVRVASARVGQCDCMCWVHSAVVVAERFGLVVEVVASEPFLG